MARAIFVSLGLGAVRAVYDLYGVEHMSLAMTPENLGTFAGVFLESAFMAFIPVALICLVLSAILKPRKAKTKA